MKPSNRGDGVLRVILFMGIGTFLFLMLMAFGLRKSLQPREDARVPAAPATSPFNESRAWADLEHLVSLGPRPAGSTTMAEQEAYVTQQLREAGLSVRRCAFEAATPRGSLALVSVIGIVEGTRPGIILLCGHYDTKPQADPPLPGANDGAANAAWLLEMGRILGARRDGRSVWLAFLDGEEPQAPENSEDSLLGSRQLVNSLRESAELESIGAVIAVNMIGDCYLTIEKDASTPPWLIEIVWNSAGREGYANFFGRTAGLVRDSQLPFREAGLPALAIVDYSYGASRLDHARNWHSPSDTLDKVCPQSLRAVGDVIYHALTSIDGHLDKTGTGNNGQ